MSQDVGENGKRVSISFGKIDKFDNVVMEVEWNIQETNEAKVKKG